MGKKASAKKKAVPKKKGAGAGKPWSSAQSPSPQKGRKMAAGKESKYDQPGAPWWKKYL